MTVIKVPKTPKSAFNTGRPASSLLQAQIEHLEAAAGVNVPGRKAARRRPKRRTEGEAAAYIARLTKKLLPQAQPTQPTDPTVAPAVAPPAQPASAVRRPRRRRRKRAHRAGPKRAGASRRTAAKRRTARKRKPRSRR